MAEYRFKYRFDEGFGVVTINGLPPESYYEEGTSLEIETVLSPGYVSLTYTNASVPFTTTDNPYTFTMPASDTSVLITGSGSYVPIDGYGLKYYSEFCDLTGKEIRLEVLEDSYGGLSEQKQSQGLIYKFGNFGQDEFDTIIGSSLDFGLVGLRDEYFELLDGGNRKFKVIVKIDSVIFWEGYIANSFLTVAESGIAQVNRFVAVDGLKSFDAIRAVQSYFPSYAGGSAIGAFTSALNQTFNAFRPLNIACDIYETRMDTNDGLFEQILVPANAIYEDGEEMEFFGDGTFVLNTSVFISEFLENMLRPFLCRLFLWKNEFYIISTPELAKTSYRLFKYDTDAVYVSTDTIDSGLDLSCRFTDGQRTGKPVFTEFTATLKLGVLDQAARGGVYDNSFDVKNWFIGSATSPYAGIYKLRQWNYINAIPVDRVTSYPTGTNPAQIQYASNALGEYCKIWGTSSTSGLADPNLSYLQINTSQTGQDIAIAQDTANKISFKVEFICEGRGSNEPLPVDQYCGIMINIGGSWLSFDGVDTFSWEVTETVMLFPLENIGSWNVIDIVDVLVPEDGSVTIRLYEVIIDTVIGVFPDRYTIGFRNLSLKIQENDAFVTEEIGAKFVADTTYSIVHPEYEINIGDVETDNSSSAIKLNQPLNNFPHSVSWSRDGIEEFPLILILLQEMANIKGKRNPRLTATATRLNGINPLEIVPYQSIEYDGGLWMVTAIELDFLSNLWRIELARLGDIPTS